MQTGNQAESDKEYREADRSFPFRHLGRGQVLGLIDLVYVCDTKVDIEPGRGSAGHFILLGFAIPKRYTTAALLVLKHEPKVSAAFRSST